MSKNYCRRYDSKKEKTGGEGGERKKHRHPIIQSSDVTVAAEVHRVVKNNPRTLKITPKALSVEMESNRKNKRYNIAIQR